MVQASDVISRLNQLLGPVAPPEVSVAGTRGDTAVKRFREGFTDEARLRLELASLGYDRNSIERFVVVALYEADFSWKSDLLAATAAGYKKNLVTEGEARRTMDDIGVTPDRQNIYILLWAFQAAKATKPGETPVG